MASRTLAIVLALAALAMPVAASAHGPSVRVSFSKIKPPQLVVEVGETVHFHNSGSTPCTVVADDGSFSGPALGRGEGFHHIFEKVGSFPFGLKEASPARGTIVVVPKSEG